MLSKPERAENVNAFLVVIGDCGCHLFRHGDQRARMEVDARGHVWFIDDYSQKRIYTHYEGRRRGFSHGGTLRDHIRMGKPLPAFSLGPWSSWTGGGDLWGHGDAMTRGLLAQPVEAQAA